MAENEKKQDAKKDEPLVGNVGNGLDFGVNENTVFLAEVDPADGSKATNKALEKGDVFDGTRADQLPPAPVEEGVAAQVLARREWERRQGELAEIPDN